LCAQEHVLKLVRKLPSYPDQQEVTDRMWRNLNLPECASDGIEDVNFADWGQPDMCNDLAPVIRELKQEIVESRTLL